VPEASVTILLAEWRSGNDLARDQLMPIVYEQLRALAGRVIAGERPDHTLAPTALVHEAYLKLVDIDVPWQDRTHFFRLAARLMRRILVDYAKGRRRQKRDGGNRISLEEMTQLPASGDSCLPEVDIALEQLAAMDPRKAEIIDLIYFGGMSYDEVALALGISATTVHRELKVAKSWLFQELKAE
jgi:RNA polymerase sigma factor (TIGR02999 family)